MTGRLDAEQLFELALQASSAREHHGSIRHLKELLDQDPAHAQAMYLLAVQYAELGLIDLAIIEMERAVAHDEALEIARLQAGILLLDQEQVSRARAHFHQLERSDDRALRACAVAMIAVADEDLDLAIRVLSSSAVRGSPNEAFALSIRNSLAQFSPSYPPPMIREPLDRTLP